MAQQAANSFRVTVNWVRYDHHGAAQDDGELKLGALTLSEVIDFAIENGAMEHGIRIHDWETHSSIALKSATMNLWPITK